MISCGANISCDRICVTVYTFIARILSSKFSTKKSEALGQIKEKMSFGDVINVKIRLAAGSVSCCDTFPFARARPVASSGPHFGRFMTIIHIIIIYVRRFCGVESDVSFD